MNLLFEIDSFHFVGVLIQIFGLVVLCSLIFKNAQRNLVLV